MTRHWQNARTIANSEVRLRIRREPNATTIETQQRLQIARYVFVRCEPFFVLNTMLYLINCNLELKFHFIKHVIAENAASGEGKERSHVGVPQNGGEWWRVAT